MSDLDLTLFTEPGGTWWDVGVPEASERSEVNADDEKYIENKPSEQIDEC